MRRRWPIQAVVGFIVAGLILSSAAIFPSLAARGVVRSSGSDQQPQAQTSQGTSLAGDYSGQVKLDWVLSGVYSATLSTPTPQPAGTPAPADLGNIDLSLHLEQSGNAVSGYVLLDRSLVFTQEHTVMVTPVLPQPGPGTPTPDPDPEELAIGPRVTGTFDGATLRLESERFSMVLSPEERLDNGQLIPEQRVTRQFSLTSTAVQDGGATLVGEYRETMWGFLLQPSTAVGEFTLKRPVFGGVAGPTPTPERDHTIYLPLVGRNTGQSGN
jgi:hypothetical protein